MMAEQHGDEGPNTMDVTQKQQNFCHRIVEGNSAVDAYRLSYDAANMSAEAVKVEASRLLDNPNLTLTIDALRTDLRKRHEAQVDRVIEEYSRVAFGNLFDFLSKDKDGSTYVDLSALTREQAACLQEVTVDQLLARPVVDDQGGEARKVAVLKTRIKLADKARALDSLAKILGLFREQQPDQPGKKNNLGMQDSPAEPGCDHLAHLAKRYAIALRPADGANPLPLRKIIDAGYQS
jgi:phage terminase small subunit